MKELLEKVMAAINTCEGHEEGFRNARAYNTVKTEARAAIRAVLEHFSEPENVTDGMKKALVDCPNVRGWKPSIAAMFRAALSELQAQGAGE